MSISALFQRLVPLDGLKETVHRFPVAVICSATAFILAVLLNHEIIKENDEIWSRIMVLLACGYLWFGAVKLIAESMNWPRMKFALVALIPAAALCFLIFMSPLWWLHLAFIFPFLLLLIMVAPYFAGGDDISFWFFNRMTWFGVAVAHVALILFAGGVSTGLVAIQTLFDVKINADIYSDIWAFSAAIIGPVYALYWVPRTFRFTDEDCIDPPALKFIVNWISVPMVFVYLGILYAYFIKIILQWELPNGQLAYLITGFAGAGIVTFLFSWPIREEGSAQLRLFHRIFFPALLIPIGFHIYAVWERIDTYGVTESRYALMLAAVWFAALAVIFTFRKSTPIKFIPMSLGVLLLLGAFGPWGAVGVSSASQMARLETLLVKHGILVNGKVVKVAADIPFDDRKRISSGIEYMCNSGRGGIIKPWFDLTKDSKQEDFREKDRCYGHRLTELMGFDFIDSYMRAESDGKSFYLNENRHYNEPLEQYDIRKYDYLVRSVSLNAKYVDYAGEHSQLPKNQFKIDGDREIIISLDEKNNITFKMKDDVLFMQNMDDFIQKQIEKESNIQELFVELENDRITARLDFSYISGDSKDNKHLMGDASFDLLFRLKK